ncbi:3-keto-5-aminohexanoate cleavage protein [Pandoraea nosoerga]|uniref:3-keto-5-aminohexanoate cleavage enzyme n=1 Tax=Pandoraea nosoerga TaxID=2508296 RepID=A0A5E4UE13_9BURK|nr:3-keto-5-aminohexanoate cleavage protein [Pandoraea nosoerga]MBN4667105.1 3-keto-5-aminohexanoate cleavage protein [Pandoraea nosoerga]MBN4677094.1 3-keto-5-aminohexanoate cleavage protein [Pandoraea nosoerga]MBN4681870.1 3-keto-5-aminohexanoate cleavage protein [Pandoraea nosoerga]MBN4746210.1 3-keto-5-aminohexanoate cleavage protein [Pandoraea nosoerga]VVD97288.1 3-keto-5-aminohexanoate cleavage enzyme [Pandoraea nosoerga]
MTRAFALAVAPNGARRTHADHPALPMTPDELGACAKACLDVGAAMIHLHVRKADGTHSLEVPDYTAAIAAVRRAVGNELVLQVTTEAVGIYAPAQQIATVRALHPEAISVALREILPDAAHAPAAEAFFEWLWQERITAQYILYDTEDVAHYWRLRASGAIRPGRHWVLFVLGRYSKGQLSSPADLLPLLAAWHGGRARADAENDATPWAMCAFGPREAECALAAVLQGGHARIGFENNLFLPDGSVSPGNEASLRALTAAAVPLALAPMTADALRELTR